MSVACQWYAQFSSVTSLGHQGSKEFPEGPNFLNVHVQLFKVCPTHFSRGEEKYSIGAITPRRSSSYGPVYACQLWSKYTQTSVKRLRVAYNNACPIIHYLSRNESARHNEVNHYIKFCGALSRFCSTMCIFISLFYPFGIAPNV